MIYALKEQIGNPHLFCGRKKEMQLLMNWIAWIPKELAKSRALLARRKSGKTAILQRIFNILWNEKGTVVPFYYEIKESNIWVRDFALDYYSAFLTQYFSFMSQTPLNSNQPLDIAELKELAKNIDNKIVKDIDRVMLQDEKGRLDLLIDYAFGAPERFALTFNKFFLVMIDEMQYMTKYLFRDESFTVLLHNLPGRFHRLSESKIAPMLVSGSYVGWMVEMISDLFPGGRLRRTDISPKLAPEEGLSAVYRYSEYTGWQVTQESAVTINELTQSDPYFINCLFKSDFSEKDLSTPDGVIQTLNYEVKTETSETRQTWTEYIDSTLSTVNEKNAKRILLFLSKERHRECTRKEINDYLKLNMDDTTLEKKLEALARGDLIERGNTYSHYKGIPDDILDKIFRQRYQYEIDQEIPNFNTEMTTQIHELELKYESLQGKYNELKGRLPEFIVFREFNRIIRQKAMLNDLKNRVRQFPQDEKLEKILSEFSKKEFQNVWMNYWFYISGIFRIELDVFIEGWDEKNYWAIVFEMKNREKKSPSLNDCESYLSKIEAIKKALKENTGKLIDLCAIYLSVNGFEPDVEKWLHKNEILTADMTFSSL
ncbi:MAG: hypothetical protein HQK78_04165 [Desulfobacterales bacterium]|nr:hypothetical protein [Desulfobacterales bacterium]